jgi:hypothetical protein
MVSNGLWRIVILLCSIAAFIGLFAGCAPAVGMDAAPHMIYI